MRPDGRNAGDHRPVSLHRGYTRQAPGSVLIEMGGTRVLCTASVEPQVPAWLEGKNRGWLTTEYAMLPGSTTPRKSRDKGKPDGRGIEIQRLIGRSIRAVVDLEPLAGHTIFVDCDVLDADGGTRTASITGAYVAVVDAVMKSQAAGLAGRIFKDSVAAISVGIIDGQPRLDLDYREDVAAEVDMNLVQTGSGRFVELQGTAEKSPFSDDQLVQLLEQGRRGIASLMKAQQESLGELWPFADR